ncbi:MAG TPA: Gfo/Idh/MocA family oxidoreductase [Candidatus Bathyarchaeia archaeon]|nr:Gfo/Idh/MocA family oxidoreductase [Candidatus Bathyarchaeia archaeon]
MRKLGIAVIGAGFWGRNHARNLKELSETRLVAICDKDEAKAKAVAELFGVDAYSDSRKMLKRKDVEAVTVCTWSTNLAVEAMTALKAGKHVLVEKPMANNLQEARKIVALAERKQQHLMVGFLMRFIPGLQRIKQAVEKGEIGTVVYATARRVSQWPERIGDVGVVKDLAIHDIDITRYIFNDEPVEVYARAGSFRHKKFEDHAQILITFKGKKTAFIEANWLTPYKIRKLTVTGSEAIMTLDYITQEIIIETSGQTMAPRYDVKEPLKLELQHFATSVLDDKRPIITGLDGLKALQIAEAALKSARKGSAVKLKPL